jgi:23S rRNA (cytidine1920-2'-O)/16S rRNA (cytidine1409-2'-O)-methyltransferase
MAGAVLVDGQRVDKPGTAVAETAELQVRNLRQYASRGGLKLAAALSHFDVAVTGRVALDCGASAGGFTDCLLQHGASLVYAVEVGYGQLVGRLRVDPRVRNMERTNLGDLTPALLDPQPTLVTLDLSYLSLTAAIPLACRLLAVPGEMLVLFKPLFEIDDPVARRTGQIVDTDLVVRALVKVLDAAVTEGLEPLGVAKLALRPRHGTTEYLLHFGHGTGRTSWCYSNSTLAALVDSAGIGTEEAPDAWTRDLS